MGSCQVRGSNALENDSSMSIYRKREDERQQYANQVGADGWTLLHATSCFQHSRLAEDAAGRHHAAHQSSSNTLRRSIKAGGGAFRLHGPQPN